MYQNSVIDHIQSFITRQQLVKMHLCELHTTYRLSLKVKRRRRKRHYKAESKPPINLGLLCGLSPSYSPQPAQPSSPMYKCEFSIESFKGRHEWKIQVFRFFYQHCCCINITFCCKVTVKYLRFDLDSNKILNCFSLFFGKACVWWATNP